MSRYCRLILKEAGACTLRRLPKFYDLTFWKKYRSQLQETSSQASYDTSAFDLFYKAFINFCSKDLVIQVTSTLNELLICLEQFQGNFGRIT